MIDFFFRAFSLEYGFLVFVAATLIATILVFQIGTLLYYIVRLAIAGIIYRRVSRRARSSRILLH